MALSNLPSESVQVGSEHAAEVVLLDSAGNIISTFGGGTEYTEDAAAAANPVGGAQILVRADTPGTLVSTDGDNVAQRGTNYGAAYVQVVSSAGSFIDTFGGSGGTAQADESAFTEGTTTFTPAGGVLNDTIASDPTEDQAAAVRITAKRAFHVNLRNVGGTEVGTAAAPVRTDPTGTTTQPVSGTVTANLAAGTNNIGDVDVLSIAAGNNNIGDVDVASIAAGDNNIGNVDILTIAAGDNNIGNVDVLTIAAGDNNIGNVDVVSSIPGTGATNLGKAEDVAHTTGDTGVYALAVRDSAPAAHSGTDGDYESLHVNDEGGLWVTDTPSASGGLTIFRSLDLDESEEEVKATAGSVYGLWFTNTATATRWLKFYNATAANVTVGTTTPVLTIGLPGNSSDDITGVFSTAHGIAFGTAITVAATTGVADNDTGAPAANDVIVNIFYK